MCLAGAPDWGIGPGAGGDLPLRRADQMIQRTAQRQVVIDYQLLQQRQRARGRSGAPDPLSGLRRGNLWPACAH
jgi:hypothetical protein